MTLAGAKGPSQFVGRQSELRRLRTTLDRVVASGQPAGVLISGEAGIGKSRLTHEFVSEAAERHPGIRVLIGRCPPSDASSAYWPLAEVLRETSGAGLSKGMRAASAALERHVRGLLPGGGAQLTELTHALAATAGLSLRRNPLERAEPRAVDAAIRRAWPMYLSAGARDHGSVLVIEDVHWADPQLLRVIEAIRRDAHGGLLVLLSTRPDSGAALPDFLDDSSRWAALRLGSLPGTDSEQLVRLLLGAPGFPRTLAAAVSSRAEGNPLYIEETIRLLADTGVLRPGSAQVVDTAQLLTSPATIGGLLAARIAALPDEERRVVQVAAMVGRRFWDGAVAAGSHLKSARRQLAALEARGLIGRRASSSIAGQHEFLFKHALIRDAAYEGTPRGRRARAHAEIGAWLESVARERVGEVDEFVADQYRRGVVEGDLAGIWEAHPDERETLRQRAFRRLVVAGAGARQRYALERATGLHRQALDLSASPAERAEALEELGEDLETGLRGEEAMEAYLEGRAVARHASVQPERLAQICMKAARTLVLRWGAFRKRPDPALMDELVTEGLAATQDPVTRCWLLALNGGVAMRWRSDVGRPDPVSLDDRLSRSHAAMDTATEMGRPDLAGFAARIVGQLEFEDGRYAQSQATMRSIHPLLPRMDSKFQRALTSVYVFLSATDGEGRYADALALAEDMVELGREMSPHEHMHGTFAMLWTLHHLGRWAEMPPFEAEHLEALRGEDQMVCPYVRSGPLVAALTWAYLGDANRVDAITAQITQTWESPGLPEMLLARIATASGRPEEGLELARRIMGSGRQASLEENAFEVLAVLEALQLAGDWDALRGAVREARRWEPALALMKPFCDRADGLIALAAGKGGPGVSRLRSAANRFAQLGVRYEVARTTALLAHHMPDVSSILSEALEIAEPLLSGSAEFRAGGSAPTLPPIEPLTDREVEVLSCIAEGLSNERIATRLEISMRTVERHTSNIYSKLGVSGKAARVAATAHAFETGMVDPGGAARG